MFAMSAVDYLYVIVCPHRPYDLFLNGRTFGDFLVDDLERKVIHVEGTLDEFFNCTWK